VGTAAEICRRVELSADAKSYLLPDLSPQGYLAVLANAEKVADAIRFLAFAVPAREGVWWACVTANGSSAELSQSETLCLERSASWVYEPTDARRRACMDAAEATNFEGAPAYAALAAFWSHGSLAPENMPDVPPDPRLAPTGVSASLLLSITAGDPTALGERFRQAIRRGADIANGGNGRLEGDRPIYTQ
jgi:hypothetical protein